MQNLLIHTIDGLTLGATYALIALGYTMVYGILGMINFAHGEVYMIGSYIGIIVLNVTIVLALSSWSPVLCLIGAFLVAMAFAAGFGFTVERAAYRPLRRAPSLSTLISAIGMSILLQNFVMIAQGKNKLDFPTQFRELLKSSEPWFGLSKTLPLQVFILTFSVALMVGLHLFITRTRTGKAMRATSQDQRMAGLLGIDIDRVISTTFVIGAVLAAAGGILVAMNVGLTRYDAGYVAGMKAFTAAVLGGIGNIPGAVLGGFLLGLVENFATWQIPGGSDWTDVFSFVLLMLILVVRPKGILGERVAEKV